jgi:hypothetical protein
MEISAFGHRLDLKDGLLVPHTLSLGLDGVVFEGLPHLEESLIVVLNFEFTLETTNTR